MDLLEDAAPVEGVVGAEFLPTVAAGTETSKPRRRRIGASLTNRSSTGFSLNQIVIGRAYLAPVDAPERFTCSQSTGTSYPACRAMAVASILGTMRRCLGPIAAQTTRARGLP